MTIPHRPTASTERPLAAALAAAHVDALTVGAGGPSKERCKDVDPATEKLLQVGELAQASGKTVRAIHLYEELGLLRPDARSKGRFRLYDPQAVTRVRWIGKLHDLGMSLSQIQDVVSGWESAASAGRAMSKIRSVYASKLDETRAQIARLTELEHELSESIAYLDTCETCDASLVGELPIPDYASANVRRLPQLAAHDHGLVGGSHHSSHRAASSIGDAAPEVGSCKTCEMRERQNEPELVAGIHHYPVVDHAQPVSPVTAPRGPGPSKPSPSKPSPSTPSPSKPSPSTRGRGSKPTTSVR